MIPAISTACLYPLETEASLAGLLSGGCRCVEIFINAESEMEAGFLKSLHAQLRSAEARVWSLHTHTSAFEPMLFFSEYPRRFEGALERYRRYFCGAAELGARVVVFHGDRRDSKLPQDESFERFARLSDAALREGVLLGQENVSRCRSGRADYIRAMRAYLGEGRAKFVFDLKQAMRAGVEPGEMISAMGTDIVNVHLSDSGPRGDCLLPGEGRFDFAGLFGALSGLGYRGAAVIEVYRDSFGGKSELWEAYRLLRSLLD